MRDELDDLGPVDWMAVGLAPHDRHLEGAVARELAALVEAELIRILDLVVVYVDEDGVVETSELEDLGGASPLHVLEGRMAEILAEADVEAVAAGLHRGERAALLVVEHTWSGPLADAARSAGTALLDSGRVSPSALVAAVAADAEGG